jgi:hypothetical protein
MQPQPQDGSAGGSVTFTVSASGTPTPTYQWVKTGVNIPGATSDVLTLNGLQASDVGSYAVVVTNSLGSVTSDAAGICELMCTFGGHSYELAPGAMQWNDAEAWAVSQGGHLVAVNSQSEQDFLLQSFGAVLPYWIGLSDQSTGIWNTWSDGEPVTYTNWASGEPNDANGDEFYATMNWDQNQGIIGLGQWNDLPGGNELAIVEIPFIPGQPTFTTQPQNSTVNAGQNTTFTVSATDTGPVTYQWQIEAPGSSMWTNLADAGEYSGSETASLTITAATADLNGAHFQCVATSGGIENVSSEATLTVDYLSGIILQSGSEAVIAGQGVSFSVGGRREPCAQLPVAGVHGRRALLVESHRRQRLRRHGHARPRHRLGDPGPVRRPIPDGGHEHRRLGDKRVCYAHRRRSRGAGRVVVPFLDPGRANGSGECGQPRWPGHGGTLLHSRRHGGGRRGQRLCRGHIQPDNPRDNRRRGRHYDRGQPGRHGRRGRDRQRCAVQQSVWRGRRRRWECLRRR